MSGPVRYVRRGLGAVLIVTVAVAPVAFMLVPDRQGQAADFLTSLIAALAVTVGVLVRRRDRDGMSVAVLLGTSTGLLMALVIASTGGRGFGLLIPPTASLALGLLDAIGDRPLQGTRESVGYGAAFGGLIGIGVIPLQGTTVFLIGAVLGLTIGMYLCIRRDPARGWRGGLQWPPWWLLLLTLALLAFFSDQIRAEIAEGRGDAFLALGGWSEAVGQSVMMLIVVPVTGLALGGAVARWLKPRLAVYDELVDYLRVMYVPIGAFSIGSAVIVLLFAGIYGSLFKLSPGNFEAMAQAPAAMDWIFFAIYTSAAADFSPIAPASGLAHLMVATQVLIGIGWAVVMFAAVMTLVQPTLTRVAERGQRRPSED
jgi:hypothetical protein